MARKLRVQYPGAIYHVINRADWREDIFKNDFDRQCFLETLGEACGETHSGNTVGRRNSIVTETTNNAVIQQMIDQCKAQLPPDEENPVKDEIQQEISELEFRLGKLKESIGAT